MKTVNIFLAVLLLLAAGCGGNIQTGDDLITVDVTKSYPKKELTLQDFMDVEYIALETGGEFYTQGEILDVGKEIIVVKNRVNDGNIFLFDRNGKGLRKINRMGRGGEEYVGIRGIVLDEENKEIFVHDNSGRKITVYDLYGTFIRNLRYVEGITYSEVYNFDSERLICNEVYYDWETTENPSFFMIAKQDGSMIRNIIQIPVEQKKSMIRVQYSNSNFSGAPDPANIRSINIFTYFPIIPYHDSWILTETSSDTIFRYLPNHNMTPFIIRTPSIQSMNIEIFLFPRILTDRFYFMEIAKKESDFSKTDLVYDRQEKAIYEYILYNDDYSNQMAIDMIQKNMNDGIVFWQRLEADDLYDACKEGQLKGKLKEVAAGLKEEDNPVIMLVQHKK